ncbi:glycosyltransferase family 2 protein, partial [Clostridium perfringens]
MSVLVSAIIPVYNSEEFLEECIVSLINQTLENIEIIVVNDGSSDKSLDILKKYEKIDSRLIIIDQKNNGPSAARNRGIEIASGEYLSFIDSDDWIDLRMYEEMYSRAKLTDADIVICDMKMIGVNSELYVKGISFDKKSYSKKEFKSNIYNELLSNSQFNSMANKIYKTKIVKENNIVLDKNIY